VIAWGIREFVKKTSPPNSSPMCDCEGMRPDWASSSEGKREKDGMGGRQGLGWERVRMERGHGQGVQIYVISRTEELTKRISHLKKVKRKLIQKTTDSI
jgi:hypothetical protein